MCIQKHIHLLFMKPNQQHVPWNLQERKKIVHMESNETHIKFRQSIGQCMPCVYCMRNIAYKFFISNGKKPFHHIYSLDLWISFLHMLLQFYLYTLLISLTFVFFLRCTMVCWSVGIAFAETIITNLQTKSFHPIKKQYEQPSLRWGSIKKPYTNIHVEFGFFLLTHKKKSIKS